MSSKTKIRFSVFTMIAFASISFVANRGKPELFDLRLWYPPQEVVGLFTVLPRQEQWRMTLWCMGDLFCMIPAYSLFGWEVAGFVQRRTSALFQILIGLLVAADLLETISEILALWQVGLHSELTPQIMSMATPLKWAAAASLTLFLSLGLLRKQASNRP